MKTQFGILVFPAWWPTKDKPFAGNFFVHQSLILKKAYNRPIIIVLFSEEKKNWLFFDELEFIVINPLKIIPARLGNWALQLKKAYLIRKFNTSIIRYLSKRNYKTQLVIIQSVVSNGFLYEGFFSKLRLPYIVIEHYVNLKKAENYIYKPYTNAANIKKLVKKAAIRFGVSNTYSKKYTEYFEAKFKTLYNPINSLFFSHNKIYDKNDLFTFLNIGGGTDSRKRPFFIIDALHKAFHEKVKLVFVGKEGLEDEIKVYAKKLSFIHEIIFVPKVSPEKIADIMDQSHVLISASEFESFGLTIIEGNARGIPSVCSRSGGPQDIVTKETGVLFNVDDLKGFVSALIKIQKSYKEYNPEIIKSYALSNFSEKIYAKKLIEEINNLDNE